MRRFTDGKIFGHDPSQQPVAMKTSEFVGHDTCLCGSGVVVAAELADLGQFVPRLHAFIGNSKGFTLLIPELIAVE